MILLSRITAISLIILAFALPYIKNEKYQGDVNKIGVYIDNSFSMERSDAKKINLIDYAKSNAKHLISKLKETQKVLILTNDFNKKYRKWYSPKDAIELIDDIDISGNKTEMQTIINRYYQVIDSTDINSLYLFSDFQYKKSNFNNTIQNGKSSIKIGLLTASHNNNISIDSCYFNTPVRQSNAIENLIATISNHSSETQIIKGQLLINNQQKAIHNIEIPPNSTIKQSFHYSNPSKRNKINGILNIEDPAIRFDNKLYFSYSTEEKIKVSVIYSDSINDHLINIFSDSLFQFKSYKTGQVEYQNLNNCELIVLDQLNDLTPSLKQQLNKFVKNGGNVFVFLNQKINIDSYNSFFKQINVDFVSKWIEKKHTVEYINYENNLFQNVFDKEIKNINLPIVNGFFQRQKNKNAQKRNILNFINNDPFLSEYIYGQGRVFLCFSDLNLKNNNFAEHALLVPCLYNSALTYLKKRSLYHVVQNETIIEKRNIRKNSTIHLKQKDVFDMMATIMISDQKTLINFQDQIKVAGNYDLIINDNIPTPISFNYDRSESEMKFLNKNDIQNLFLNRDIYFLKLENNNLLKKYEENQKGKSIENFFILLAIILLIIELLLLKIWKV